MTDIVEEILKEHGDVSLEHHGIKGMHWGIRNERTSTDELKKQARTAFAKKTDPVAETRIKQMFDISPLSMNDYNKMSTKSTSIPAGKTLYRLTRDPTDTSFSGVSFVTTNKKDAEIYRGLLPSQRLFDPLRKSDYKQHYELTLKNQNGSTRTIGKRKS